MAARLVVALLATSVEAVSLRRPSGAEVANKTAAEQFAHEFHRMAAHVEASHSNASAASVKTSAAESFAHAFERQTGIYESVQKSCDSVCSYYPDISKCMTGCETELYRCHDKKGVHPSDQAVYEACEEKTLKKYKDIHSQIGHLLAVAGSTEQMRERCLRVCGGPRKQLEERSCLTDCEVELFQCADHVTVPEGKKKYDACAEKVMGKYEHQASHNFLAHVHVTDEERKRMRAECEEACGESPASSCLTGCEVEMYQCADHNRTVPEGKPKFEDCTKKVLEKYTGAEKSSLSDEHEANYVADEREHVSLKAATSRSVQTKFNANTGTAFVFDGPTMCRALCLQFSHGACPWTVSCLGEMRTCAKSPTVPLTRTCANGVVKKYKSMATR